MRGIVYVSEALVNFDDDALEDLTARSATANAMHEITGYMYFERQRFLQYIEGPSFAVTDLMSRIEKDARHRVLNVVHDDNVLVRRFPTWDMLWLRENEISQIRFERVLLDHLLLIHPASLEDDSWRKMAWSMVDTIADLRVRFSRPPR